MTKKHLEMIAKVIKEAKDSLTTESEKDMITKVTQNLMQEFFRENPRFDGNRFMKACGF